MTALSAPQLSELLSRGCPACGRGHLRASAFTAGTMSFLEGEPVSAITWVYDRERFAERVYRVACADCGAELFARDDCPACGGKDGVARALGGQHGIAPPSACPHCDHPEISLTAEARITVVYVLGKESRRVLAAEPHEPGFHGVRAECSSCKQEARAVMQRCAVCGRSSLLRKRPAP